ncbi:MAG: hypothetical protein WBB23_17840 [Desulforhopalus sp.]
MNKVIEKNYTDWIIRIIPQKSMDESFSFEIIDPHGNCKHVDTGGNTLQEAIERAKKMVDVQNTGSKFGVK